MNRTLCMIVKNEAHVIRRALRSVRPFIDSYSISDTGSTDNTKAIIAEELEGIPGVLASDEWVDFATNRNLAMSRAAGTHCITLDADEVFEGALLLSDEFDGFHVRMPEGDIDYWSRRIVRNDGLWKWEGAIHESLHHPGNPVIARLACCCISTPHDGARDRAGNKTEEILSSYEKSELSPRDIFHYAQALRGAARKEDALLQYNRRTKLGEFEEEVYYSAFQAGILKFQLGNIDNAIATLLKAYFYRPSRYEALIWACMLLRKQEKYREAYIYSCVAPKPSPDLIFVERNACWRILEEHALASADLGLIPEAKAFFEYALSYDMDDLHRERLTRNLKEMEAACIA